MSNEKFNLGEMLNEMEAKAGESTPSESKVSLSQLNQAPEEKKKLFQNKKANIAIGVGFGVIVLAFAALMVVPMFLH